MQLKDLSGRFQLNGSGTDWISKFCTNDKPHSPSVVDNSTMTARAHINSTNSRSSFLQVHILQDCGATRGLHSQNHGCTASEQMTSTDFMCTFFCLSSEGHNDGKFQRPAEVVLNSNTKLSCSVEESNVEITNMILTRKEPNTDGASGEILLTPGLGTPSSSKVLRSFNSSEGFVLYFFTSRTLQAYLPVVPERSEFVCQVTSHSRRWWKQIPSERTCTLMPPKSEEFKSDLTYTVVPPAVVGGVLLLVVVCLVVIVCKFVPRCQNHGNKRESQPSYDQSATALAPLKPTDDAERDDD